jgi:hypothetical protein
MNIKITISIGELVDKITILELKEKLIPDEIKKVEVKKELKQLQEALKQVLGENKELNSLKLKLGKVNKTLWKIEDEIRICEKEKSFDEKFIKLARSVYVTNDQRFNIKNEINKMFSSEVVEVKSYEDY